MDKAYNEYYRTLGLDPGCSWTELRLAYRRLVRVLHPDHRHDFDPAISDDERIKHVNIAYRKLSEYYRRHGVLPEIAEEPHLSATETNSPPQPPEPTSGYAPPPVSTPIRRWRSASSLILLGTVLALAYALVVNTITDTVSYPAQPLPSTAALPEHKPAPDRFGDKTNGLADRPHKQYFRPGSTIGEVIAAQGPPTQVDGNVWHYGTSKVFFRNGRVTHWEHSEEHPLNTGIGAERPSDSDAVFFSKGSTKSDVRSAQGPPLFETDTMWDYGASRVFFKDGHVSGWEESPTRPLRLKR